MSTFVLLPGAGGSAWYLSRVVSLLADAGHEAIALDLPGHDESAGLAEYARIVVDAVGDRWDVVVVAQSLGAFTAAPQAAAAAAEAGGYGDVDLAIYFLHDIVPEIAAEGEAHQRPETDAAFASV